MPKLPDTHKVVKGQTFKIKIMCFLDYVNTLIAPHSEIISDWSGCSNNNKAFGERMEAQF